MTKIVNIDNYALTLSVDMDVVKEQVTRMYNSTNRTWSDNPEYNLVFLKAQQAYANDLLTVRGHLFLNEIYDALGYSRTDIGAVVGWRKGSYVVFGTFGVEAEKNDPIRLEFNVDGPILDLI